MRQPFHRADRSGDRGFWQEWLLLFGRAYAGLLLLGGIYLFWLLRHQDPNVFFGYQAFYIGLYLTMATLPVAVETAFVTLVARVVKLQNPRWRLGIAVAVTAVTLLWFFPPAV